MSFLYTFDKCYLLTINENYFEIICSSGKYISLDEFDDFLIPRDKFTIKLYKAANG